MFHHGDLPSGAADLMEIGDGVAVVGGPAWNGFGGLGAVEVNDERFPVAELVDGGFCVDKRERAHRAQRVYHVCARCDCAQSLLIDAHLHPRRRHLKGAVHTSFLRRLEPYLRGSGNT